MASLSSRLEDLRDLAQLLDEGKISQSEYEVVKTEILEASPNEWAADSSPTSPVPPAEPGDSRAAGFHEKPVDEGPVDGETDDDTSASQPEWVRFVKQIPTIYWAAIGACLITVLYGGNIAPVAWVTTGLGGAGLAIKKVENGRWMAWTAIVLGVIFSMANLFFTDETATADPIPASASMPEVLAEIPIGSLGVRFGELPERWNALDKPPYLLKGISATPEPGPLDAFTYRFDGGAVLAGAYNPSDDYIYALMVRAGVRHEASATMYVHLCYLLYPGTQECFDAYVEESGIFGKKAEGLEGSDHYSSWVLDGNEWRLEIANDIQTMRVLGPS